MSDSELESTFSSLSALLPPCCVALPSCLVSSAGTLEGDMVGWAPPFACRERGCRGAAHFSLSPGASTSRLCSNPGTSLTSLAVGVKLNERESDCHRGPAVESSTTVLALGRGQERMHSHLSTTSLLSHLAHTPLPTAHS